MNSTIEKYVKTALNYKTGMHASFSAYDITQLVRGYVGQNVDVPHYEVRDLVHSIMSQNKDYSKRDNGSFLTWVYRTASTFSPVGLSYVGVKPKPFFTKTYFLDIV